MWAMLRSFGRPEPAGRNGAAQPDAAADDLPLSAALVRALHADLVRQRRRALWLSSPLLLLAGAAFAGAAIDPKAFGSLAFIAVLGVVVVGRRAFQWWTIRRADPMRLQGGALLETERLRSEQIEHLLRSSVIRPFISVALTACIVMVTAVELFGVPFAHALQAAALVKPAVRAGEWWRLLTAAYLHGSLFHLFSNAYALMVLGPLVEVYDRRMRIPLVFLAAAVGGGLLSTVVDMRTSLGASGGIIGLAGYLFVVAGRQRHGMPAWLRRRMLSVLGATALMGIVAFAFIDNAGHLGGALTGAALGVILPARLPSDPPDAIDAAGGAAASALVAGALFTVARLLR
jgi:membrane associated rhomboid family serine protease